MLGPIPNALAALRAGESAGLVAYIVAVLGALATPSSANATSIDENAVFNVLDYRETDAALLSESFATAQLFISFDDLFPNSPGSQREKFWTPSVNN